VADLVGYADERIGLLEAIERAPGGRRLSKSLRVWRRLRALLNAERERPAVDAAPRGKA
jgi:hypothetical protein